MSILINVINLIGWWIFSSVMILIGIGMIANIYDFILHKMKTTDEKGNISLALISVLTVIGIGLMFL